MFTLVPSPKRCAKWPKFSYSEKSWVYWFGKLFWWRDQRKSTFWDDVTFKCQLISKYLFGVFNFSQKTNENKSTWGITILKSNFFIRFFGKIEDTLKSFWNYLTLIRTFNFVFVSCFRPLWSEHRSKSASEGGGGGKVWVLHRTNNSSSFPVITIMLSPNLFLMDDSALITV